jgi:hypothetical protein
MISTMLSKEYFKSAAVLGHYLFGFRLLISSLPTRAHDMSESLEDDVLGTASFGNDTVHESARDISSVRYRLFWDIGRRNLRG